MNRTNLLTSVVALAAVAGSIAWAQTSRDTKPAPAKEKTAQPAGKDGAAGHGDMQLPPGWTSEDMQACMAAGTPGEQHAMMQKHVGTWNGKSEMWMAPGMPSVKNDCVSTTTSIMDGRFVQIDHKGEIPGMGMYHGSGVQGFDNVSGKLVATWIDNHGTGIMIGTGEMSKDGKTSTINYTYNCPLTKKPAVMREVSTVTGANTMTMEMFTTDPKSGKEYKMMKVDFTKKS